jgi:hypothetical protein
MKYFFPFEKKNDNFITKVNRALRRTKVLLNEARSHE